MEMSGQAVIGAGDGVKYGIRDSDGRSRYPTATRIMWPQRVQYPNTHPRWHMMRVAVG